MTDNQQDSYEPVRYSTTIRVNPADVATSSSGLEIVSIGVNASDWLKLIESQFEEAFRKTSQAINT